MGLFRSMVRDLQATTYPPDHDFWYTPLGASLPTDAGVRVSESVALAQSAVYQATRLISETVASLTRRVYQRLPERAKRDAPDHWAAPLLRVRANPRHTSQEWFELMTACALLWGDGFSRYLVERGQVVGLWPLHPSRMTVTETSTGRLAYRYRNPDTNQDEPYTQDEIFHLRGFGTGVRGYSVITQARQSIGLAVAMESHGARVFSQGTRLSGVLSAPGVLTPDAERVNRESWQRAHGGLRGAHSIAVLSGGMTFQTIGMSQEDAQYIASRDFQVRDVCRWFNLSEHMLRVALRPIYATPEQLFIELMELTIRPWVVRWEQRLNSDLLDPTEPYFVEFNLDSVYRADLSTRTQYFASAVQNGYQTRNEIRALMNLEPLPGLDVPLTPSNMQGAAEPSPTTGGAPHQDRADDPDARARAVLHVAAERALRREADAIRREATAKHLADVDGWRAWVAAYYARHAGYLSESLALPLAAVRQYCEHHRAELLAEGPGILTTWERDAVAELVALTEGA